LSLAGRLKADLRQRPDRTASEDVSYQVREVDVAFTGAHGVDERTHPQCRAAHDVFTVRATEHDKERREGRLEPPGQRQRSAVLLETRGETDQRILAPGDRRQALLQERSHAAAHRRDFGEIGRGIGAAGENQ
jgi:hypothetical protein